jgi:hypothetical protein
MKNEKDFLPILIISIILFISLFSLTLLYKDSVTGISFVDKYYVGTSGPLTRDIPHVLIKGGKIENINKCLSRLGVPLKKISVNCYYVWENEDEQDILCFFKDLGFGSFDWFKGETVCYPDEFRDDRLVDSSKDLSSHVRKQITTPEDEEVLTRLSDLDQDRSSFVNQQTGVYDRQAQSVHVDASRENIDAVRSLN